MQTLAELADLKRYPIQDPEERGAELVEECRERLAREALCLLPGFLRPAALEDMRTEVLANKEHAIWVDSQRTPWSWRDASVFPNDHPAQVRSPHKLGSITRNHFDENRALLRLFRHPELTQFVRRVLNVAALYPVECPYLSVNVKVMTQGSRHGWHFDSNDGAVSLLLSSARAGGHYEYVPYLRGEDENYNAVEAIIKGDDRQVKRIAIEPGTLCLFNGHRSLHRVSPVTEGEPDRLIALYAYDRQPGLLYNDSTLTAVLGEPPRSAPG